MVLERNSVRESVFEKGCVREIAREREWKKE